MNELPRLSEASYSKLITSNRGAYCAPVNEVNRLLEGPPRPTVSSASATSKQREPSQTTTAAKPTPAPRDVVDDQRLLANPNASDARPAGTELVPAEIHAPRPLGKGGKQHKYVQHLTKRLAEELGYRAVIEERVSFAARTGLRPQAGAITASKKCSRG